MPLYQYTAKTLNAKTIRGQAQAADEIQLSVQLRETNLYLLKCREIDTRQSKSQTVKTNELASFCRELGTMLSAGLTLVQAMEIFIQQNNTPRLKKLYGNLCADLKEGMPFSAALQAQGKTFPPLLINMFRAGEVNGTMGKAALKAAGHFEKEHKINSKMRSAMTYPLILLFVSIAVMIAIFTLILPQFFDLFKEGTLPLGTKILISVSNYLTQDWQMLVVYLLLLLLIVAFIRQFQSVQLAMDQTKLRIPKVKNLLMTIYTARFARTLSTLYSSGLTMLQALPIAAATMNNQYIYSQFGDVITMVRSGIPLSEALRNVNGFAPKLSSIVHIGEESGRLDEMLDSMADAFDYESEQAVERLITLIEPAMIIVLALIVGTIMVSVMLPLYNMYQTMG